MATCANCSSDALYVYEISPDYAIEYCQRHLPKFLYSLRNSGGLKRPEVVVPEPVVEAAPKKAKKTTTPAEEAPTEEATVEETVVEADAVS
jgi:hypothetical protein